MKKVGESGDEAIAVFLMHEYWWLHVENSTLGGLNFAKFAYFC